VLLMILIFRDVIMCLLVSNYWLRSIGPSSSVESSSPSLVPQKEEALQLFYASANICL
jgi:hypothetical protein